MGYHEQTRRMKVLSLHPGVTLDQAYANTGFQLAAGEAPPLTPSPTPEELAILRQEVDPHRYLLGP